MECNIKVKSYFCDVDHKSAVKNFRIFSIYFNRLVDDLFFAAFLIKSASLQNDKWGKSQSWQKTHNFIS